ncbi:MBL fold metallo-hydrolase [Pantoea ananatis]
MSLSLNVFRSSVENDSLGATSTIIMGAKDAIIVDPQFTLANAYRLIAEVIEMNKNIIKIFITNLHPDHILGVQVIKFFFLMLRCYLIVTPTIRLMNHLI